MLCAIVVLFKESARTSSLTNYDDNFDAAKRRILNLSECLVTSPKKLDVYVKSMQQLFKDGHVLIFTIEELIGEIGKIWYLNHHLVHYSGKDRVVFKCSGEFQEFP